MREATDAPATPGCALRGGLGARRPRPSGRRPVDETPPPVDTGVRLAEAYFPEDSR